MFIVSDLQKLAGEKTEYSFAVSNKLRSDLDHCK